MVTLPLAIQNTPSTLPAAAASTTINFQYAVHLDRKFTLQGVLNGADTEWTLPITDDTLDLIVLSDDFGSLLKGTTLTVEASDHTANVISLTGTYTDGPVTIGRTYQMSIELTKPYRKDRNNVADLDGFTSIINIVAAHHATGPYDLRRTLPGRTDSTKTFTPATGSFTEAVGTLRAWFNGNARDMQVFIESTNATPVNVAGVKFVIDHERTVR